MTFLESFFGVIILGFLILILQGVLGFSCAQIAFVQTRSDHVKALFAVN